MKTKLAILTFITTTSSPFADTRKLEEVASTLFGGPVTNFSNMVVGNVNVVTMALEDTDRDEANILSDGITEDETIRTEVTVLAAHVAMVRV